MRHSEATFRGTGGLELYWQGWLPDGDPSATIVIVHGVGEHSGRYMRLVRPLVEAGYAVYGYDHRGHGRSEGARVHVDEWREYTDDLETFLTLLGDTDRGAPVVLYGHSMGSLVVLDYLEQHPRGVSGAIISGVALQPAGVGSPALIAIAKVLSRVAPKTSVDLKIRPTALTRDPEALAESAADENLTSRATARWGTESMKALDRVRANLDKIEVPLLVVHGGADPLNLPAGARELCDGATSTEHELRIYADSCHEPHNDLEHERLAADVTEWLANLSRQAV